ncbi:MAG: MgtC/SapB family protein, partial [Candidatus Geothermincolia bacterium]
MSAAQMMLRIAVALGCGAAIGIEREREDRPAGFRTNTLVTLGSALFTVLSIAAFPGSESARVAAQIVVGIGFIGAGVIILHGGTMIVGLTSAATMWMSAAIGMAAGAGHLLVSAYCTALVLAVIVVFRWVENMA